MSKWWWKSDYIETCNCAHGCSCNLTMIPTDGTCQAIDAWKIREGAFEGTRLDGLGIAIIVRWPNPIHRGNGRCVVFIDELADDAQRKSLSEIGTGKAGQGGPFEIFATTYAEPAAVRFGHFTLSVKDAAATWNLAMLLASRSGQSLVTWIKAKQTRTWFYPEDSFGAMEK